MLQYLRLSEWLFILKPSYTRTHTHTSAGCTSSKAVFTAEVPQKISLGGKKKKMKRGVERLELKLIHAEK